MTGVVIVLALLGILVLGPLGFGVWHDRRTARGLVLGARIQAAVNRVFGGESFLSVEVTPPTFWSAGRVLLSVPAGYESLIEAAWGSVLNELPCDYEVVVRAAPCAPSEPAGLRPAA